MENDFVTLDDIEYVLKQSTYPITNQIRLDLMLFDPVIGGFEPFIQATKEIEHVELEENEVVIKNYLENEGILQALIKEEVIARPHETIKSGYVDLHICQLIN